MVIMVESLREREVLYKLIISQLRYDGLDMVAANLAKCVGLETTPLSPSSRLLGLMKLGLQEEKNGIVPDMNTAPGLAPPIPPARGLDLEYETEGSREIETTNSDTGHCSQHDQNEVSSSFPEKGPCPGIFVGSHQSEAMPSNLDGSVCNDDDEEERDLNAQPTMIACRDDAWLEECVSQGEYEKDCGSNRRNIHSVSIVAADDSISGNIMSVDGHVKAEHNVKSMDDYRLSEIVDFDPRNKGKLTDRNNCSSDVIYEAFRPFKEESVSLNFKELVSSELLKFGINQSIFAKTVLKRSQGYLSDLLNHQEAIFSMEEPSRMLTNFLKIKQFLGLDEMERKSHYLKCVEKTGAELKKTEGNCHLKISPRKKRVTFTKEVKDELRTIFKDRTSMPDVSELAQMSTRFELEISTIKNFFRNLKARSKIS